MSARKFIFLIFRIDFASLGLCGSVTYYFPKITDSRKFLVATRQATSITLAGTYRICLLYKRMRDRAIFMVGSSQ